MKNNDFLTSLSMNVVNEARKIMTERKKELSPAQKKLDVNKNCEIDAEDLKAIRNESTVIIHSPYAKDIHGELAEMISRDARDGSIRVMFENKFYDLKKGQFKQIPESVEEFEQLDELSKKTLASYIKMAAKSAETHGKRGVVTSPFIKNNINSDLNKSEKSFGKAESRHKYIGKAADKLANEETEVLAELEKKTLKSYIKKATTSSDRAWRKADQEEDKSMSTDGEKYPEKQKRHMDAAGRHLDTWNKRRTGLEMAKKKVNEGFNDEYAYFVIDESFGVGEILEANDETATVIFEGKSVEVDVDTIFVEDFDQLDEISKATLHSYNIKAQDQIDKSVKRGPTPKATIAMRAKRNAGMESAKEKLQKIVQAEHEAHEAKMKKSHDQLDNHFEKEAPKVLEKHGFKKVHDHPSRSTWIHPHDNGHVTMISLHKNNDANGYYTSKHEAKASNTKGSSWGGHNAHGGPWDEAGHNKEMKEMMPRFENHVISVKNATDEHRGW